MRLRTFESFWLVKNGILNSYPSLQKNSKTQLVVVGGGITGALISHALMEKGYKVMLLDRRDIAMGSTAATTSMLQYEIDKPLCELSDLIGEPGAVLCYKEGMKAIYTLQKLVSDLQLDCGFEMKDSLYIAHSKAAVKKLKEEFEMRQQHLGGVQWLDADAIEKKYGLKSHGGILSSTAASVDAYKLAHELIRYNADHGMQVYDQTDITHFDFDQPNKVIIHTDTKHTVTCKQVIFCSGFESVKMLQENIAHLFYTYACVSERFINVNERLQHTLVWDTGDPYHYMRTTDDGRLLIGGEDAEDDPSLSQQKIKEQKGKKLERKIKQLLPGVDFIADFNWGGTFGSTKDGLPYIGRSPEYDKAIFVLGFGGNGITFSVQGMEIVCDILEDKKHPLQKYYKFGRAFSK